MTAIKLMFVIKKILSTKNKTIFHQITVQLNANLFLKKYIQSNCFDFIPRLFKPITRVILGAL